MLNERMFKKQITFFSLWDYGRTFFLWLTQSEAFPDITGAARVCACRKKNQEPDTPSCKAALAGRGFSMLTTSQERFRSPSIHFPRRKPSHTLWYFLFTVTYNYEVEKKRPVKPNSQNIFQTLLLPNMVWTLQSLQTTKLLYVQGWTQKMLYDKTE